MTTNIDTTRRAVIGAIAATPSDALTAAADRHSLAAHAINAHRGDEDVPQELVDEESKALLPCDTDDFYSKMRYMLAVHKTAFGGL